LPKQQNRRQRASLARPHIGWSAGDRLEVALRGVGEDPLVAGRQRHVELARGRDQQPIGRIAMQRPGR
jgi:hypothetical protein